MKRVRLISIGVAVIVLGGLSVAIYRAREPRYQGRKLSDWIMQGAPAYNRLSVNRPGTNQLYPESDSEFLAVSHAVKQMAPEAVPLLLKWFQAKDSKFKEKIVDFYNINKPPALHTRIKSARDDRLAAIIGFWLLEDETKAARPTLIQWTTAPDPERRMWALYCLVYSKPDKATLMPVLLRMIHDPDTNVQSSASYLFHYLYHQNAEVAGLYKLFPKLQRLPTNQPGTNQTPGK